LRAALIAQKYFGLLVAHEERGPHGVQRLLLEAEWDQEAARDELRSYVLAPLGEQAGIVVVDETGFLKKGKKSAGVAPQ
jgi:SRSO17 transposase